MKVWTGHVRLGSPPVLVREGFSWGALLFGPIWLAAHRAWIAAALILAVDILIVALTVDATATALLMAVALWLGLSGQDLRRWSMQRRGFTLFGLLVARDEGEAFVRMLDRRPDLAGGFLSQGGA